MRRLTGLLPDRQTTRDANHVDRSYGGRANELGNDYVFKPVAWVRNQLGFPSCAGQCLAAGIDAQNGAAPWASAVGIWRDARRRQGLEEDAGAGTRFEYAIASLINRGWDPYFEGEDTGQTHATHQDGLGSELFADDKRLGEHALYYVINNDVLNAIDDALLNPALEVVIGTGTTDKYQAFTASSNEQDVVMDTSYLGGWNNGHGQRVFGRDWRNGKRVYYVQGSWGFDFAGCHMPGGQWRPGCYIVDESVIIAAWDRWVIQLKK